MRFRWFQVCLWLLALLGFLACNNASPKGALLRPCTNDRQCGPDSYCEEFCKKVSCQSTADCKWNGKLGTCNAQKVCENFRVPFQEDPVDGGNEQPPEKRDSPETTPEKAAGE